MEPVERLVYPGRASHEHVVLDKKADLGGPRIGDHAELERILPDDSHPLLTLRATQ